MLFRVRICVNTNNTNELWVVRVFGALVCRRQDSSAVGVVVVLIVEATGERSRSL